MVIFNHKSKKRKHNSDANDKVDSQRSTSTDSVGRGGYTRNPSVFFAPERMKKELIPFDEIEKYQNEYVERVSGLNIANAHLTDVFTYKNDTKMSIFKAVFDDMTFSVRNVSKFLTLLAMVVVLVIYVFTPIISGKVPFAMADNGSKLGISTSYSFGASELVDTAIRADPSFAQNVTINDHGKQEIITTTEATVRGVLKSRGITTGYGEGVYPALDTPVGDNAVIAVDRIDSRSETVTEHLPHSENRVEEPQVRKGQETVIVSGQDGEKINTYIIHEVAGQEISRSLFAQMVVAEPQDTVIQVGTAEVENNGTIVTVGPDEARNFALSQVRERGWGDEEFVCLDKLWQRESGWRVHAGNIFSGAYGIPQSKPGNKMAAFGEDWRDNAEVQIRWGIDYISKRYGAPCVAWGKSESVGWY
jgi:hypothetical protein